MHTNQHVPVHQNQVVHVLYMYSVHQDVHVNPVVSIQINMYMYINQIVYVYKSKWTHTVYANKNPRLSGSRFSILPRSHECRSYEPNINTLIFITIDIVYRLYISCQTHTVHCTCTCSHVHINIHTCTCSFNQINPALIIKCGLDLF